MARENYSYKKFQRELAQKKKREEKLQKKLDKKKGAENIVLVEPEKSDIIQE